MAATNSFPSCRKTAKLYPSNRPLNRSMMSLKCVAMASSVPRFTSKIIIDPRVVAATILRKSYKYKKESLIIAHSTTSNVPKNRLRGQNLPHFPVGTEIGHCAFHVDSHKIAIVYVERIDADDFRVAVQDDGFSSREKGKRGKVVAILLFGECDDVHVLSNYLKRWAFSTSKQTQRTGVGFLIIAIT